MPPPSLRKIDGVHADVDVPAAVRRVVARVPLSVSKVIRPRKPPTNIVARITREAESCRAARGAWRQRDIERRRRRTGNRCRYWTRRCERRGRRSRLIAPQPDITSTLAATSAIATTLARADQLLLQHTTHHRHRHADPRAQIYSASRQPGRTCRCANREGRQAATVRCPRVLAAGPARTLAEAPRHAERGTDGSRNRVRQFGRGHRLLDACWQIAAPHSCCPRGVREGADSGAGAGGPATGQSARKAIR
jgi:hypothetical protein